MSYVEYIGDILKFGKDEDRKDLYHNGKDIIDKMQGRLTLAKGSVTVSRNAL